jgi:hypothetical protein
LSGSGPRSIALDRHANGDALVIDLDLAEILVVLFLALGNLGVPSVVPSPSTATLELVAVEVIALGDLVADFDRLAIQRARRGLEGDRRIEEFLGVSQREKKEKRKGRGAWSLECFRRHPVQVGRQTLRNRQGDDFGNRRGWRSRISGFQRRVVGLRST